MPIHNHNWVGAVSAPSPNHSGQIVPRFVVMHYTASWGIRSVLDTFSNPRTNVSAQVTIDTDGTIYQHVPFNVRAWHAGPSSFGGYSGLNGHSVGIELVNPGYLRKLDDGRFIDAYEDIYSPDKVGPVIQADHPRVGSGTFYWPAYTKPQIGAAMEVVAELVDSYPIMDIVTHEEIDNRGWKTDPGPAFPMNRFKSLLMDRGNDVVTYEVTARSLNVRGGPGSNYRVVGGTMRGRRVEELERSGPWVRVSSDGWVHGGFLRRVM